MSDEVKIPEMFNVEVDLDKIDRVVFKIDGVNYGLSNSSMKKIIKSIVNEQIKDDQNE